MPDIQINRNNPELLTWLLYVCCRAKMYIWKEKID